MGDSSTIQANATTADGPCDDLKATTLTQPGNMDEHVHRCEVVQFQRRAERAAYSVERLFDDVRAAMPADIDVTLQINRFLSRGVLRRCWDMLRARRLSGEVNHILGDVHYLGLLLPRGRTVLTVLDCVSLQRGGPVRRWLLKLFWYRLPLRRAARVTVISDFTRRSLAELCGYPAERVQVIPPPVSPEFTAAPQPLRAGPPRLLQVGTKGNKNLPRLIEAVRGIPLTLVIVGTLEQAERSRLAELSIHYENHVNLTRAQLAEQYRLADVVVFASTYEGFGLPIVEAQAVGRPVITSNLAPMPDTAGGAACFVDPFDVADIRRGIRRVLEDPEYAHDLVRRGLENAHRFTPAQVAEQYAAIYREVRRTHG